MPTLKQVLSILAATVAFVAAGAVVANLDQLETKIDHGQISEITAPVINTTP